jgi:probable rRNA maturation factor
MARRVAETNRPATRNGVKRTRSSPAKPPKTAATQAKLRKREPGSLRDGKREKRGAGRAKRRKVATVEIDVRNKCKGNIITTHRLKKITNNVLKLVLEERSRTGGEVSVVFVDDGEMRNLNRNYRGMYKSTDVLAFPMNEGRFAAINPELLGDIVISVPQARRQAETHGHSIERELSILLIHGLLHLFGYDHQNDEEESAMKELEIEYLMLIEEELSIA